jgi:hypothetical protein
MDRSIDLVVEMHSLERRESWKLLSHKNFGSEVGQSSSVSAILYRLANQNLGDTDTNGEKQI